MLEITGEGGAAYVITTGTDVDVTDETTFTFTVAGDDKLHVDGLLNKNLGLADDGSTNYNLKFNDDWMVASATSVDIMDSSATIAVTGYVTPTYTSARFDYVAGTNVVTGTNFAKLAAINDVEAAKFTIVGEGAATYALTTTSDVDITDAVSFTLTLSDIDLLHVRGLWNKNGGTADTSATTFNFQAADGWLRSGPGSVDMATSSSTVTVINYIAPVINTVGYDYTNGQLQLVGNHFASQIGTNNDLVANAFTVIGEASGTYTLVSSSNVDINSLTTATFTVSDDDRLTLNALWNKDGGTADDTSSPLQVNIADDWMAAAAGSINIAVTAQAVSVSAFTNPVITSAGYNFASGTFEFTGDHLARNIAGGSDDIDVSRFTITGFFGCYMDSYFG